MHITHTRILTYNDDCDICVELCSPVFAYMHECRIHHAHISYEGRNACIELAILLGIYI